MDRGSVQRKGGNGMSKPLVSVCMPVLNGELFLSQALDSLLGQDYDNIEIIILDNMSTDNTQKICNQYAEKDRRVRYIIDNINRNPHDAANHLATFTKGEYCMLACDDDLWEPEYISRLVSILNANPEIGMAYSNAAYVDTSGRKTQRPLLRGRKLCKSDSSKFSNFWKFLVYRQIVPMIFGLFRTPVYKEALPFDTFDETIADVDNLFILKLLTIAKVHSTNEILFHYRNKYRWADPDILSNYPKKSQFSQVGIYNLKHQLRFTKKILDVIEKSTFTGVNKTLLRGRTIYSLVRYFTIAKLRSVVAKVLKRNLPSNDRLDLSATQRHNALISKKASMRKNSSLNKNEDKQELMK